MALLGCAISSSGRYVEVKTARTHYAGHIVGYLNKSGKFQIKITKTIKGKLSPGRVVSVNSNDIL